MDLKIEGVITNLLPHRSGVSQRTGNPWEIAEYVLTTEEQYPKHVCFQISGPDRIKNINLQQNEKVTVYIDIDAHEFNGKWYNSITAYRVDRQEQQAQAPAPPAVGSQPAAQAPASSTGESNLPF